MCRSLLRFSSEPVDLLRANTTTVKGAVKMCLGELYDATAFRELSHGSGLRRHRHRGRHLGHVPAPSAARPGPARAGFEAGDGVGGTWDWNRHPRARFHSQSWTYGYLFLGEVLRGVGWTEPFG